MKWRQPNIQVWFAGLEITSTVRFGQARWQTAWQNPPANDHLAAAAILAESTPFTLVPKWSDLSLVLEARLARFTSDGHGGRKFFFTVQLEPKPDAGEIKELQFDRMDSRTEIVTTGQDGVSYTAWDGHYLLRIFFRRTVDGLGVLPSPPAYLALNA